jgi:hypothetical protein
MGVADRHPDDRDGLGHDVVRNSCAERREEIIWPSAVSRRLES